jgi:hypothetical protein
MDTVGKVFVVEGVFRRCIVCDDTFTVEASKEHATAVCFPPSNQGFPPSK